MPAITRTTRIATALTVVALTACSPDIASPRLAPSASSAPPPISNAPSAAATLRWNALVRELIVKNQPNQQAALRTFVYVSLARDGAIRAIDDARSGPHGAAAERRAAHRVALSIAAADVLRALYPADGTHIDAVCDSILNVEGPFATNAEPALDLAPREGPSSIDPRQPVAIEALAHEVAASVIARAASDGFDAVWTGSVPTGAAMWVSASGKPPLLPLLGRARTFYLSSGSQFRPAPPPMPGTRAFQDAVDEVRRVSDTRTPEQQRIAQFWAMGTGPLVAGYWNAVADSLIAHDRLDEGEAAHVLALANTAGWDANVACHDAKYTYWLERPTQADPKITLAIALPNHPSYPSNHGCLSGAMSDILAARFTRDADALHAQAQEAVLSRVYAGVHYRFDGEVGLTIAHQVSALALSIDGATRR